MQELPSFQMGQKSSQSWIVCLTQESRQFMQDRSLRDTAPFLRSCRLCTSSHCFAEHVLDLLGSPLLFNQGYHKLILPPGTSVGRTWRMGLKLLLFCLPLLPLLILLLSIADDKFALC